MQTVIKAVRKISEWQCALFKDEGWPTSQCERWIAKDSLQEELSPPAAPLYTREPQLSSAHYSLCQAGRYTRGECQLHMRERDTFWQKVALSIGIRAPEELRQAIEAALGIYSMHETFLYIYRKYFGSTASQQWWIY